MKDPSNGGGTSTDAFPLDDLESTVTSEAPWGCGLIATSLPLLDVVDWMRNALSVGELVAMSCKDTSMALPEDAVKI